jgi:hypothetical protein
MQRSIRALEKGPGVSALLPAPPVEEAPRWVGRPCESLCANAGYRTVDSVYRRILDNNPDPGDVQAFGSYLTAVLLGPNLNILEGLGGPVDLRLNFDDPALERLPWEMMYGPDAAPGAPDSPLCARPNRRTAVNREVPMPPGAMARANPQTDCPLRVLFVAESTIDDVLRPGAEFLH